MGWKENKYLVNDDTLEDLETLQEELENELVSHRLAARTLRWIIQDIERGFENDG